MRFVDVFVYLIGKLVYRAEFFLGTKEGQQFDSESPAVKIACEIKNVCLCAQLLAVYCGAEADICDTVMKLSAYTYPADVHAVTW